MGLLFFVLYLGAGLILLAAFTWLYIKITPFNEAEDIATGRMAPAIALAGAMLGFTFPLIVASYTRIDLIGFMAWGFITCLVQLAVFRVMVWLLPRSIENNNVAAATCFATASVCVGLLNAASFIP